MVLVLAALYQLYKAKRQASDNTNDTTTATSENDENLFTERLRRGGSVIYQNAVLRCAARADIETEEQEELEDEIRMMSADDEQRETPSPNAMVATSGSSSGEQPEIFLNACKNEWIDAVFGRDFLRPHCPVSGSGIAGEFQTVTVSIPAESFSEDTKVGVTVSRLPIGVYVRAVTGEAAAAGICPHSVLIAINDLPVLAEPSKQLIERLWQYEGYYSNNSDYDDDEIIKEDNGGGASGGGGINSETNNSNNSASIREPVALKFVHQSGKIYTALLLSNPPWGIQWAPVGNFALVKRVYSLAAAAGVQRGSLVVAVNGRTCRDMDHVATASHIRDLYENRQAIRLTMAFPPVTARASHYERLLKGNKRLPVDRPSSQVAHENTNPSSSLYDGVEIKFLPLGYAIGSLCSSDKNVFCEPDPTFEENLEELAEQVAAGRIEAPMNIGRRRRRPGPPKFLPCPSLRMDQLLEQWDPLETLVYCLRLQRCSYDAESFLEHNFGEPNQSRIEILHELVSGPNGADLVSAFLLQFISLICAPGQCVPHDDGVAQEKQSEVTKKNANELTSMLLKLSRKNEAFCQRLYFLLRSYISTFETSRPASGSDGDSRNLMALLNCLELLRFAEKELAGRQPAKKPPPASSSPMSVRKYGDLGPIKGIAEPSPVPSPIPASPESPFGTTAAASGLPKKKGMLGFLRKKSSKSPAKNQQRHATSQRSDTQQPSQQIVSRETVVQPDKTLDSTCHSLVQSPSTMYDNMSDFLTELDKICAKIESSLQKSFRQKIADWAMQPWSAGKDAALAEVTADMRRSLEQADSRQMLLVNPVESSELLSSVDYDECYILPSAHFPILLTFNVSERRCSDSIVGEEKLFRTKIELLSLKGPASIEQHSFAIQGSVAGALCESGESSANLNAPSTHHTWNKDGALFFENRSSWGAPQTLSLRLSGNSDKRGKTNTEIGYCWVDLSEQWKDSELFDQPSKRRITAEVWPIESAAGEFDDHGGLPHDAFESLGKIRLDLRITTEAIEFQKDRYTKGPQETRKRMLLYKHDDDLRQEAFAVQFIRTCDNILKASGLDMKLLTFQCIPVGTRRGFVEWVPGSIPLSEICHPFAGTVLENRTPSDGRVSPPMLTKAGLSKYESLRRLGGQQTDSLRRITGGAWGSIANNPVQNYLRSVAFDPEAPYLIRQDVMDTYVKSCAGYSIITYLLGVGDRHLDNLLLHQSGSFFHCDYSFLLGSDPKKYLSMRITEDMVYGMGGKDSDNYAKFLSLIGAAFLALRRPENVRVLLSMVRLMKASCLPDISEHQTTEQAILGVRYRLRLELSDAGAISFMEALVEASLSNKMWIAMDALHHLGKKF